MGKKQWPKAINCAFDNASHAFFKTNFFLMCDVAVAVGVDAEGEFAEVVQEF